jgi:dihydrofolate reductase
MIISLIVAADENGGIGLENQMPWHLPADLARFKKLTMGHHLIVGRKTYQSIGSTLPGRQMILLTRNPDFNAQDCIISESLADALHLAEENGEKEVFIIGGAQIYREALPLADKLYLTVVHTISKADTFFPKIENDDWSEICSQDFPEDEQNSLATTFKHLVRK